MSIKKIIYMLIIVVFIILLTQNVQAFSPNSVTPTYNTVVENETSAIGAKIISLIQIIGSIVSVAILVVIGIKYMLGTIEEKAHYKKTMIPYIVGAVLLFAATTVASALYNMAISL